MEGQAVQVAESTSFLNDWFFNMFAATLDMQIQLPTFALIFIGLIAGLVILRTYIEDPAQTLAAAAIYIYSIIQSYALFSDSTFIVDTTEEGWLLTGKAMCFAFLFTTILVWGFSKVVEFIYTTLLAVGLGSALAYINPLRLVNLFRSSDAELEQIDDSFHAGTDQVPKRPKTAIMMADIIGFSKQMGADVADMYKKEMG